MKWFLAFIVVGLLAALIFFQRNGVKTSYVNGLPEYSALPGKEYIFEHDCYVFEFKKQQSVWPLVGANDPHLSATVPELPPEVSEKNIGAALPMVRILDVIHIGSLFKIISVRREESRQGTLISFEILFLDEAQRRYPRLDAYWILDHTPEQSGAAPRILDSYAVERVKK